MSGAPIIMGIIQFAKPTKAGMIAPNTMISPCRVVIWLKKSGIDDLHARLEQLGADDERHDAADKNMAKLNHRYIVPMSL
jgi:hypothetical protein